MLNRPARRPVQLLLGGVAGAFVACGPASSLAAATPARWSYPAAPALVRATPSEHSRVVGRLHFLTEDDQAEVYAVLAERRVAAADYVRVSLPRRPNGATGWVPRAALGTLRTARTRLAVNRARRTAVLYRGGRIIWHARVGVGRPSLPTPAGHFYVREKLRSIGGPGYGPYAIGTSAYAARLSDWPGGGVVGLYGTDEPNLIPGAPSHGCVRLRNREVTKLGCAVVQQWPA